MNSNLEIEKLLKNKNDFTEEEKNILMTYSGAGGRGKDGFEGRGLLDEYYTPEVVIKKIWETLGKYLDFEKQAKIIEPSVGIGSFLKYVPNNFKVEAFEINPTSAKICKILYKRAFVKNEHFESLFVDKRGNRIEIAPFNQYDLVIGNPPYGIHRGRYKGLGEEPNISQYEGYFIKRGLDLLRDDGVLAYVIPSGFIRGTSNGYAKKEIARLGDLIEAYRLPNKIFKTTEIGTDIVFIKKQEVSIESEIFEERLQKISNDKYFLENSNRIIGREISKNGRFRDEQYVEGSIEDVEKIVIHNSPKTYLIKSKKEDEIIRLKTKDADNVEKELWDNSTATGEIDNNFIYNFLELKKNSSLKNIDDPMLNIISNDNGEMQFFNNFNYYQGNIYDKLDRLEIDKENLSVKQYGRQKQGLEEVLPKKMTIDEISLSPIDIICKTLRVEEDKTLQDKFLDYIDYLEFEAFMESSEWEIREYIRGVPVRGNDAVYNAEVRRRRREIGNKLFKRFLVDDLTVEQKKVVENLYNRQRNAIVSPDYSKVPLNSKVNKHFKGFDLELRDVQLKGAGFLVNKGVGCLAHEVGAGKTLTAIVAVNELLDREWIKKPIFVVPRNIYDKWINEIIDVIPNVKVNALGNLGTKFRKEKIEIGEGTITVVTIEGFAKLGLKEKTYRDLVYNLKDTISGFNTSKRESAKELEKAEETIGRGMRGTKEDLYFEDLGFDHIVFDEAHRYKNIFTSAKLQKGEGNEYRNVRGGRSSSRGIKAYLTTQYILEKNRGRGVMLLTATPFTNNPIEYYSMLSLLGKKRMEQNRITNVNIFMTAFMDLKSNFVVKADRSLHQEDVIEKFKNAKQLRKLIFEYYDFKTGDELGIVRPIKHRKTVILNPTVNQQKQINKAENLFNDRESGGAIVAITEMQNITLSPYLSRYNTEGAPSYKEFVENSPKIIFVVNAISRVKQDCPAACQVIHMSRGIGFHTFVREYLIKEVGYKESEVAIISGKVNKTQESIDKVRDGFNEGKIKVLIGSDTIKEGIDLQKRTTDLYILHLPWNPLDLDQVEGRIWRYGNMWKNVRVTYPLIENTIDPFIFQKLETKLKRIKNIHTDNSNEVEVGELDFEGLKLDLITDPVKRVKAEKVINLANEYRNLKVDESEKSILTSRLNKVEEIQKRIDESDEFIEKYKFNTDPYLQESVQSKENKKKVLGIKIGKEKQKLRGLNIEEVNEKTKYLNDRIIKQRKKLELMEQNYDEKIEALENIDKKEKIEIKENDYKKDVEEISQENRKLFSFTLDKENTPLTQTEAIQVSLYPACEDSYVSIVQEINGSEIKKEYLEKDIKNIGNKSYLYIKNSNCIKKGDLLAIKLVESGKDSTEEYYKVYRDIDKNSPLFSSLMNVRLEGIKDQFLKNNVKQEIKQQQGIQLELF